MSKPNLAVMAGVALSLLSTPALEAQILDLTQRYQVIERDDTDELYRDLSKAGQNGIRVMTGSSTGDNVMVLLGKVDENQRFEYFVVAADKPADVERQIGHAGRQGYRLLPATITLLKKTFGSNRVVMIFEKPPETEGTFEYLLLDASLGQTMQVTLAQSIDRGFHVLGMFEKDDKTLLVLERKSN